jgi:hypothetical protein
VLLAVIAIVALAACGRSADSQQEVARPVAPPPLPSSAKERPRGKHEREARTAAAAPEERGSILSPADAASFRRLNAQLGGVQGVAVSAIGFGRRVERTGALQAGVAWSTSKVPIAMAIIARRGAEAQGDDLSQAISASDNAAAMRLWAALGGGDAAAEAADEQLRQAGDRRTQVEARPLRGAEYTPFGQTVWTLGDQTRFVAGMPCLAAGAAVLGLMDEVVSGQRWGLGAAGVDAQFKGGWGPGSQPGVGGRYFDRQMGVLTVAGTPLAVAIASLPADGTHATGTRDLTAVARWLVAHADVRGLPHRAKC